MDMINRDPTNKRPPLKRIADLLGVSKMTVSRALREGTSVDEKLRAKIQETARQIGYQPDSRISQVMSAIRKSQTPVYRETLALVWTHRRHEKEGPNFFYEEIFAGANHRALQLGYKLDEHRLTDQSMSGRVLSRILHTRGIRGVLIAPPNSERTHPHVWLDWKKFCCVLIGRSFANANIPRVQPDHYLACVLAIRRLKRLRYRRIGLVLSRSMDERTVRLVRSAFLSFHPLEIKEAGRLIFTSDLPNPKALAKWMDHAQPDVILTNFENPFPRPEQLLSSTGAKIDLAALNWSPSQLAIAGIDQQLKLIGGQAIDLLVPRLQNNQLGQEDFAPIVNVPGTWVNGPSIRQAPALSSDPGQESRKSAPTRHTKAA